MIAFLSHYWPIAFGISVLAIAIAVVWHDTRRYHDLTHAHEDIESRRRASERLQDYSRERARVDVRPTKSPGTAVTARGTTRKASS